MSGHSAYKNKKHRKGRQDKARSQSNLQIRRKLELLIKQEGRISERALVIARENNFPKEKVYQIEKQFLRENSKGD
jgi:transcriptional/translational regulatory protein YebC/TACO1